MNCLDTLLSAPLTLKVWLTRPLHCSLCHIRTAMVAEFHVLATESAFCPQPQRLRNKLTDQQINNNPIPIRTYSCKSLNMLSGESSWGLGREKSSCALIHSLWSTAILPSTPTHRARRTNVKPQFRNKGNKNDPLTVPEAQWVIASLRTLETGLSPFSCKLRGVCRWSRGGTALKRC